jgi:hypothetical protein
MKQWEELVLREVDRTAGMPADFAREHRQGIEAAEKSLGLAALLFRAIIRTGRDG